LADSAALDEWIWKHHWNCLFSNAELAHLQSAPAFNLHCALQQLSVLPAPTSHSSSFSTSELPQKLPDGAAHDKEMTNLWIKLPLVLF